MSRPFKQHSLRPAAVALVVLLALFCGASRAMAGPVGYLYSATGSPIAGGSAIGEYAVGSDSSLSYLGSVPAGPVYGGESPGTLMAAKTAEGESLYQLAGKAGGTQSIYQYTVDTATGAVSAKSPAAVGSMPLIASGEQHAMAVFDPAGHGESGQAALYVISGREFEQAIVYVFDIDPVTGALTEAGEVEVPGVAFSAEILVSGHVLITASGKLFQRALIDPATGGIEFESLPDIICPSTECGEGVYMLDSEHMLTGQVIAHTNEHGAEVYVSGFGAYEVGGGWGPFDTSWGHAESGGFITADEHEYLVVESDDIQAYSIDGLPEGYTPTPTSASWYPDGAYWFENGLYVPLMGITGDSVRGFIYHFSSSELPVESETPHPLGSAIVAFKAGEGGEESEGEEGGEIGGGGGGSGGSGSGSPSGAGGSSSIPVTTSVGAADPTAPAIPPPKTKILSVKTSGTVTTIRFTGSGGKGKLTFRCALGAAKKAVACASPLIEHHLAAGKHHFAVDAVDSRGVGDPSPAHTTFTTK